MSGYHALWISGLRELGSVATKSVADGTDVRPPRGFRQVHEKVTTNTTRKINRTNNVYKRTARGAATTSCHRKDLNPTRSLVSVRPVFAAGWRPAVAGACTTLLHAPVLKAPSKCPADDHGARDSPPTTR